MKLLLATVVAVLAVPASAFAAGPTMAVRDVPLHASRALATAPPPFDMVGLHWRGSGAVFFRARTLEGRWSAWTQADADDRVRDGWHLGGLDWTGAASAIRVRTSGHVTRVRAYYVASPVETVSARRLQVAGSPLIISRFSWQADESIRRAAPQFSDAVHYAVVHHTAGSNAYTREESAAIVRGIEIYHVQGNGWNDIGYNFLVDKYGQVFEGRYGGVDKAVIGAHAEGFNTGSVGIAVLGSYGATRISAAARASLEQLLAWKLDLAHVDPLSTLTWKSGGNPRFASGVPVFLRAISGHRDTGFTDCPGDALYAELPQIAKDVSALGGPKIYAPAALRSGEGQVRFTAKLSVAQPWTVTILNSAGVQVAQGTGTGSAVDWTWDGSVAAPDRYSWTIASASARPATGTLGTVAALAVQNAVALPAEVAPGETTTFAYTLTVPATVTATLVAPNGQVLSTLLVAPKPAGAQTLNFTPPPGLVNGQYTIGLAATAAARTASAAIPFTIDDILTGLTTTGTSLSFALARAPFTIAFQVLRKGAVVAVPTVPVAVAGAQTLTWDKLLADGTPAPDGRYTLSLTITDEVGTFTRPIDVTLDTKPPAIRVISYRTMRFAIGEAAALRLTVGPHVYTRVLKKPATTQFWLKTKPARYTLTATDAAGNRSVVRYRR
jgi:N-acetylmuramoyl-L-alanine amidase